MDEAQHRPAENLQTAESRATAEADGTMAENRVPEENRTFWADRHPGQPESGTKKSKAKTMTVAAAIFAAAGLTAFAGVTAAELLHMGTPEVTAVQTETTVTETAED